jgi:hypothetical protein
VISIDPTQPDRPWQEVVPESPRRVLQFMQLGGGALILQTMDNVNTQLDVFDPATKKSRPIELPTLGMPSGLTTYGWERNDIFFALASLSSSIRQVSRGGAVGDRVRISGCQRRIHILVPGLPVPQRQGRHPLSGDDVRDR